jgi:hypothetical protein
MATNDDDEGPARPIADELANLEGLLGVPEDPEPSDEELDEMYLDYLARRAWEGR